MEILEVILDLFQTFENTETYVSFVLQSRQCCKYLDVELQIIGIRSGLL